jgi:hypothetical protein
MPKENPFWPPEASLSEELMAIMVSSKSSLKQHVIASEQQVLHLQSYGRHRNPDILYNTYIPVKKKTQILL